MILFAFELTKAKICERKISKCSVYEIFTKLKIKLGTCYKYRFIKLFLDKMKLIRANPKNKKV